MDALAGPPVPSSKVDRPVVSVIELTSPSPGADESSASDESDSFLVSDDPDEIRATTYALGLSRYYVPNWKPVDAFREFYQNWKDAIVASFDLDPRSFAPRWRETPNQVQITVHRAVVSVGGRSSEELLGYIRLNKKAGVLELANFKARLEMRHLSLGGTTKYGHDRFAGVHGEGLKLAALVMRRNRHAVRVSSSSFYWNFGFRGMYQDKFYCRLSPAKPEMIQRKKEALARKGEPGPRKALISHIWEDVTVKISKGRAMDGIGVTEQDLRSWATASIDLHGPALGDIIRTDHGDLILDQAFSGRTYLKGLRVTDHSPNGKKYVFGYNFARGNINRDREQLTNPLEEATMLAKIWEQPILDGREDIVRRYIGLFRDYEDSPDVAFAEKVISAAVAETIWGVLRTDSPDTFFYCESVEDSGTEGADPVNIIVTYIKRRAEKVPKILWRILRKFSLVRTPQEERLHLFMSSEPANVADNLFGANVFIMLQATLQLDPKLEPISTQIVKGGETGIDLVYKEAEKVLLINEKWLDFNKVHEEAPCELSLLAQESLAEMNEFTCDHVVEDLFELVIEDIRRQLKLDPAEATTIRRGLQHGELEVRWTSNESGIVVENYGENIFYDVTLHRVSSCQQKSGDLIHRVEDTGAALAPCGCPHQIVSRSSCKATFAALDCEEEYFPMVARTGMGTFYGTPPAAIAPQGRIASRTMRAPVAAAPFSSGATPRPIQHDGTALLASESSEFVDLTEAYSSDNDEPMSYMQDGNTAYNDTLARRPRLSPGGGLHPQLVDAHDPSDWQQDEQAWHAWHKEELPQIASELFSVPARKRKVQECKYRGLLCSSLICERLECTFEKDAYVYLRENSERPTGYVALIHEVHSGENGCAVKSAHVAATKYSFLEADALFGKQNSPVDREEASNGPKEVLLHFTVFDAMGMPWDAEVIDIDDIIEAHALPLDFEIIHCAQAPLDCNDSSNLFCRFALTTSDDFMVITPLASVLLPRRNRRKVVDFTEPSPAFVVDLTPNVLGPVEGFIDSGHRVYAGIGFDEERHMTWRLRNPACKVFDGSPQSVFDDFVAGKLLPPDSPPSGHPKVVLVAGENSNFRLSDGNTEMPSKETFLTPLDIMDSATSSPLHPDFTALLMPPAILHRSTISRLTKSIWRLLEQGQSVRISLPSLERYGLPQDRSTLVIIGTRYPGLPYVRTVRFSRTTAPNSSVSSPVKRVKDFVEDLRFENSRATLDMRRGFTCSPPIAQRDGNPIPSKNIYNHQTGQLVPEGREVVANMDADTVPLSSNSFKSLVHPGFKDDFVFYGSIKSQYDDVLTAQPPIIARGVAEIINSVAKLSQKVEIRDTGGITRVNKRARVEDTNV